MTKISVIVPVYKVERYLDRCVASVCGQTLTDIEIILVDDGSPDQCPRMCDEWARKDARIRVIHKDNGGLGSARNAALEIASGEYINFVDSDDWMEPDALEYLLGLCEAYDADFSMAGMTRTEGERSDDPPGQESRLLTREEFLKRFFKIGTQESVQYACAKLYRRKLFASVRYPEGLTAEDVPAIFEIAMRSQRIAYSTRKIYHYFLNPESITGSSFSQKRFDLLKVWDLVCEAADRDSSAWVREQARICRARADLGVLCNLAMANIPNKAQYEPQRKACLKSLRGNRRMLYAAHIPFSRKALVALFCVSYPVTAFFMEQANKFPYRKKA